MSIKQLKEQKGFTLIEIIIVLAIAALIILVVLQAVAGAQKSQRDNTRKQEGSRIVSYLTQWASNNGGKYPAATDTINTDLSSYDTNLLNKWTVTNANTTAPTSCPTINPDTYQAYYLVGSSGYDFSFWVCLESGGLAKLK